MLFRSQTDDLSPLSTVVIIPLSTQLKRAGSANTVLIPAKEAGRITPRLPYATRSGRLIAANWYAGSENCRPRDSARLNSRSCSCWGCPAKRMQYSLRHADLIYNQGVYLCKLQNGETAWRFDFLPRWSRHWTLRRETRSRSESRESVSSRSHAIAARRRR